MLVSLTLFMLVSSTLFMLVSSTLFMLVSLTLFRHVNHAVCFYMRSYVCSGVTCSLHAVTSSVILLQYTRTGKCNLFVLFN